MFVSLSRRGRVILLAAMLVLISGYVAASGDDSQGHEGHEGHDHAAEAGSGGGWTDLTGKPTGLDSRKGKLVLVNFWATWCRPCIREMPDLIRLHDAFAPYGVEFVAAAADPAEEREVVLEYVRKHRINFPVVLGATTPQMEKLGLPGTLPSTVILDEHGCSVAQFPGVIDPGDVEAKLWGLLGLTRSNDTGKSAKRARARTHSHGHGSNASLVPS